MQGIKTNKKVVLITLIAGLIILLGLVGGNWQKGYAQGTLPTIPTILLVEPNLVIRNSVSIPFVITGTNFIGTPWSLLYTLVIFTAPDGRTYTSAPDSISADGRTLVITIPEEYLEVQGIGSFWVDNHPAAPGEVAGPAYISIIDFLYLPVLFK